MTLGKEGHLSMTNRRSEPNSAIGAPHASDSASPSAELELFPAFDAFLRFPCTSAISIALGCDFNILGASGCAVGAYE